MQIDLNADLGESFGAWTMGNDEAMLEVVTSANVACGFHAGDPRVMRRTVAAAAERGVTIGAHVSYPDREGFGRRFLDIAPAALTADVLYQLGALDSMCRIAGTRVRYVKPHGALYNAIADDSSPKHEAQAVAVLEAITLFDPDLAIACLPGSLVLRLAAEREIATVTEAFADRAYRPDGSLVPRSEPGAVLHDPEVIAQRAVGLIADTRADTLCVHGDTPNAVAIARQVRAALAAAGVRIAGFR